MARRSKLTTLVQERVVAAIHAGAYPEQAVLAAGISKSSFYRWMVRGRGEQAGAYVAFVAAIERAEAEEEVANVAIIHAATPKHWQAAAWMLERRHPDRWGRRDRFDFEAFMRRESAEIGKRVGIDPEELADAASELYRRAS